jgi:hypothetical protein
LAYSSPCFSWSWFQQRNDSPYLELKAELGVLLFLLQLESLELLQVLSNVLAKEKSLKMKTNYHIKDTKYDT